MIVLDACALIAYLRGEPGSDIIEALLLDPDVPSLIHAINLCEVYYDFPRASDEATATNATTDAKSLIDK
jgi:hypothetical protein